MEGELEQLVGDLAALLERATSNSLVLSERRRWNDEQLVALERVQMVLTEVDQTAPRQEDFV